MTFPDWLQPIISHAKTWAHHGMIVYAPCSLLRFSEYVPWLAIVAFVGGLTLTLLYTFREIADVVRERQGKSRPHPWWDHTLDALVPWYVVYTSDIFSVL